MDGPDDGESVGEVSGDILASRCFLGDAVGGNSCFRRFRHSSSFLIIACRTVIRMAIVHADIGGLQVLETLISTTPLRSRLRFEVVAPVKMLRGLLTARQSREWDSA